MPQTANKTFTMNVTPAAALAIVDASVPDAIEFSAYSHQFTASGGTAPYAWQGTAGAFPAGLTLSTGGLLSGVPSVNGAFGFTIQVTDSGA